MLKFILIHFALFIFTQITVGQEVISHKSLGNSIILHSEILQSDREIQLYLPDNYEASSNKYPVLYVLDGQRYFLNGITFQQNLTWQEITPEFIIVGIITDSQKRRTLFYDDSSLFIKFLETELIPKIHKDYRTLNQRIFFGWEMGAGLGVEILAEKPSLFTGFLLASPTHISSDRLEKLKIRLNIKPKKNQSIYASLGKVELWALQSMYELDSLFLQNKTEYISWKFSLLENENHYSTPLFTINEGLKSFFSDFGPLRFFSLNEFKNFGGLPALKKHYAKRGEKYQIDNEIHDDTKHYLFLQSVKENDFELFQELIKEFDGKTFIANYYNQAHWFTRFSTFYLSNESYTDAIEILELGLSKFPQASIIHNEMGNYFKTKGQVKEAKEWYNKAIRIAEMNHEKELFDYKINLDSLR